MSPERLSRAVRWLRLGADRAVGSGRRGSTRSTCLQLEEGEVNDDELERVLRSKWI